MSVNPKVIFGMKLKQYREQASLSLTKFASMTGLSTSYLTEIEHGKKYPKAEKIIKMAEALDKSYDDLVSIRVDKELTPLAGFLGSPVLNAFPYDLFGISPAQLVDLLISRPAEASSLVNALIGIAEQYNIRVEHLFRAALRSYQELHGNYFGDIEDKVKQFVAEAGVDASPTCQIDHLLNLIRTRFDYQIDDQSLKDHPRLSEFRSVLVERKGQQPLLLINPALSVRQRKFILAREIGYRVLGIKSRALVSPPDRIDSFEQVLGDFKASYFAGALLVERSQVLTDIQELFGLSTWQPDRFLTLLDKYQVTPEMFLYRLTELLPQEFGIKMHFLRFNLKQDAANGAAQLRLVKHLNMSQVLMPGGTEVNEHYCRRWEAIRILEQLADVRKSTAGVAATSPGGSSSNNGQKPGENNLLAAAQLSRFLDTETHFLCISLARPLALQPDVMSSVSLGFRCDEPLRRLIKFIDDPAITRLNINGTCERCRMLPEECHERVAPPTVLQNEEAHKEIKAELASLSVSV